MFIRSCGSDSINWISDQGDEFVVIVHHEVVHVVVLGGLIPSSAPLTASLLDGTPLDATGFTGAEAASRRTNHKVKAASDAVKLTAHQ